MGTPKSLVRTISGAKKMREYLLIAGVVAAIINAPQSANAQQRPPLFGTWAGGIKCDQGYRRLKLMMYGNGTGLLMIGRPSWNDSLPPDVADVTLQQPPEADVVSAWQWRIGEIRSQVQLVGRLDAESAFAGEVRGASGCHQFAAAIDRSRWVDQKMRRALRSPERFAEYAVQDMIHSDHQWTAGDVAKVAALIFAYRYVYDGGSSGAGGGGLSEEILRQNQPHLGNPTRPDRRVSPPSVQGDVQGNLPHDVQGNGY